MQTQASAATDNPFLYVVDSPSKLHLKSSPFIDFFEE